MFAISKGTDLNFLVPGGQLYWAFPSSNASMEISNVSFSIGTLWTIYHSTFQGLLLPMLSAGNGTASFLIIVYNRGHYWKRYLNYKHHFQSIKWDENLKVSFFAQYLITISI